MFTKVQSRRTFEEAIEQIAYAVRVGDLRVGDRLPSERALAAQMDISRPTLREAIKVLANAGILRVEPGGGGGTIVKSEEVPSTLLAEQIELRIGEVAAVLEARRLLEPQVAQLAGIYATHEDLKALGELVEEQRRAIGDRDLFGQLDERFHIALARATGNEAIVDLMRGILRKLAIAWDSDSRQPLDGEHDLAMHERTLAAIVSRDPAEIEAVMDEHLSILEQWWEVDAGRPRLRRVESGPRLTPGAAS
jgi:GntR family transcriptional regulator, transcriptional repressor for pyruvate dehydrogenase complex